MNPVLHENPFLKLDPLKAWGPASFDMALPLVKAINIRPGMRVLEVGGGSGYIATTIAQYWNVSAVTLEPWAENGNNEIQAYAAEQGVENQVLQLKIEAQSMPFADNTFDAVISIGSFEMIGDERPLALSEMIRVTKTGSRIGIAEPMCLLDAMPDDLAELDKQFNLRLSKMFFNFRLESQLIYQTRASHYR